MKMILLLMAGLMCLPAMADGRSNNRLERQVRQLQIKVIKMDHRLKLVEDFLTENPQPDPRPEVSFSCMLVDSGYSKTFLSKAKSRLSAEFAVKKKCENSIHASYCSGENASMECDSNLDIPPGVESYVCVIVDTGYSKSFKGKGYTEIEAEANAKIACQNKVHSSYCGPAKARCEAIYR